ncbi:MAG: 2-hydroxychromene-2-carboxylate isomerase [Rhodospirillales bacterium]|nr:2-hydroxychromene-2-carboxylate isomerase [Rhodospirillales bacterium]
MEKIINYYFSPISPWTYLGNKRLGEIAIRNGVKINHKPVKLGEVFAASGGLPLFKRPAQRQAYRMAELKRWREFLNVDLTLEPKFFPVSDDLACKLIIACDTEENRHKISHALMCATWVQERDISDEETLSVICTENGLDGPQMIRTAKNDTTQITLDANTKEAIEVGVFGSPSYVYNDQFYWGQDRLKLLEIALKK